MRVWTENGRGDVLESCSSGHNSDCVVYTLNITHLYFSFIFVNTGNIYK